MTNKLVGLVLGCCFVGLAGCGPKTGPIPGPVTPQQAQAAQVRWPEVTPTAAARGRELFEANCNRCHGYPDVRAQSEEEWPKIVKRMGEKAKLSTEESHQVLSFILAAR
jgi:cytochrome c5